MPANDSALLTLEIPKHVRIRMSEQKLLDLVVVGEESIRLKMGDQHLIETIVAIRDELLRLKAMRDEP